MADTLRASEQGLKIVDEARRKKGWQKNASIWVETAPTSEATLRRFWARKSAIDRYAFIGICQAVGVNWEEIAEPSEMKETELPAVSTAKAHPSVQNQNFVGREKAIDDLNAHINQGAKIIVIQALGGVGKTTLAQEYLNSQGFELVIDLPMAKEKENIQLVESVIEGWLKQDFDEEPGREFWEMLRRLKRQLQTRKIGVLIDNLEPALDAQGRFIEPHRRYVELLRVLADATVQSVTLITSRVRLCEPDVTVDRYVLPGLDHEAWKQFFTNRHINIDDLALKAMHKAYGGNAKAMGILCGAIREDFDGYMVAYWQANSTELLVKTELKNLVTSQFNRLQELDSAAYKLLCRLGCYRYQDVPRVPTEGLLCLLWDVPEGQKGRVIESLRNRSLMEFHNAEFWLHPVIREEAISRLRESEDWETGNRKNADFWSNRVPKIETIKDAFLALEAYYHYVNISDFEKAGDVILQRRNTKLAEADRLGRSFYRLGLIQQISAVINQLIAQITCGYRLSVLYSILGVSCRINGKVHKAIECHKNSLNSGMIFKDKITLISEDSQKWMNIFESNYFLNVGLCYIELGEILEATKIFEKLIDDSKKTGFYRVSIDIYFCYLKSCQELSTELSKIAEDFECQVQSYTTGATGYRLLFLGMTYKNLGKPEKALKMYNQAISLDLETQVKGNALTGIAEIYRMQQDFQTALSHHSEAIEILEKIGAKANLAEAYYQLGLTYQTMGNAAYNQENFNKAITIFTEMEAPKQIEKVQKALNKIDEI
ncbi:tetratricopeptide repeat protein [Microcoleus vaginatus GB1-A2]|uniref:tetratricopeptide repeat protein n=1 Tax=Microcoleus vaginatus TaxID=119532 RepID=UPI0016855208|nr:tetratricopeptide repeat protein [Microcoleus sp. FACHB-61]